MSYWEFASRVLINDCRVTFMIVINPLKMFCCPCSCSFYKIFVLKRWSIVSWSGIYLNIPLIWKVSLPGSEHKIFGFFCEGLSDSHFKVSLLLFSSALLGCWVSLHNAMVSEQSINPGETRRKFNSIQFHRQCWFTLRESDTREFRHLEKKSLLVIINSVPKCTAQLKTWLHWNTCKVQGISSIKIFNRLTRKQDQAR